MTNFRIDEKTEIVCEWKKTKTAFKHEAALIVDNEEVDRVKICYLNRTWERFEFDSVIEKLVEKNKKRLDKEKTLAIVRAINEKAPSPFAAVAMIAQLGEVFGKNQREKNDWKARMLKAGLEGSGLTMPEDWDSLDESTKEARLNAAIESIK